MQKFINITVILLAVFSLYYGVLVDYTRSQTMERLEINDEELQGHKNVIDEEYRRLSLKFDGRGKHIQLMAMDIAQLQARLQTVTDSLGNRLEEINFLMLQIEENLQLDIRDVDGDVRELNDELSTYKRNTNRSIIDMQERINVMESDLKALSEPEEGKKDN